MKTSPWIRVALLCVMLLTLIAAQTAPQQEGVLAVGSAVVSEIKGEATFTSPEGAAIPAQRGVTLPANTRIETVKGTVLLELQDGSQVWVKAHCQLTLRAPDQGPGYFLELLLGKIMIKVQKRLSGAPSFRMGTPSAVITVRGTRFSVEVNKKQKTYVDVFEGLVDVGGITAGAPHVLIRPGFFTGVDVDRTPENPREMGPNEGNQGDVREREGGGRPGPGGEREDQPRNQPRNQPQPRSPSEGGGKPD